MRAMVSQDMASYVRVPSERSLLPISSNLIVTKRAALRLLLCLTGLYCIMLGSVNAQAQANCTNPIATRPILFVHGIWEDSSAWGSGLGSGLRGDVISAISSEPGYSNTTNYNLYLDWAQVRISTDATNTAGDPLAAGNIPCDARFFSIRFFGFDGDPLNFDPSTVAGISVNTKAYELSQVIKTITAATYVKDVIVIAQGSVRRTSAFHFLVQSHRTQFHTLAISLNSLLWTEWTRERMLLISPTSLAGRLIYRSMSRNCLQTAQ